MADEDQNSGGFSTKKPDQHHLYSNLPPLAPPNAPRSVTIAPDRDPPPPQRGRRPSRHHHNNNNHHRQTGRHHNDHSESRSTSRYQEQQQQPQQHFVMLNNGGPGAAFFLPHHELESLDAGSRNPLLCLICNSVFEDPRLLSCFHSFCAKCIQGRSGGGPGESRITCPLCGKITQLKDGSSGPPSDMLLQFLLHFSSALETDPPCANCDRKGRPPMYYCNTCGQALCTNCREETHRAKMFSAHDIIPVSKFAKETPKKCAIHGEQFIMFSTVERTMLCINCYRDTAMEARVHCVDLDTAYHQGCRKLDRAVLSLRDLQVAVRDGITMLKNVLEELRRNSDSEKSAVNAVVQTILNALTKTQENILKDVDCQSDTKDKVIRGQLAQLSAVLPTIKLHLAMCATIASAANKYDFLDLAYPLIDRLTAITHMGYPVRPGQSSQIKSTYKTEIGRTLEPWIASGGASTTTTSATSAQQTNGNQGLITYTLTPAGTMMMATAAANSSAPPVKNYLASSFGTSANLTSQDPTYPEPTYSQYYPLSRSAVTPIPDHHQSSSSSQQQQQSKRHQQQQQPVGKTSAGGGYAVPVSNRPKTPLNYGHHSLPSKMKARGSISNLLVEIEDSFTSHCRSFNAYYNDLTSKLNRLKDQVQDLHRDVTLQQGSQYSSRAEIAMREGINIEDQLSRRQAEMERLKKLFDSTWKEHLRQVKIEQDVFQAQLNDLVALKAEVKQISGILQQIQSFLQSGGPVHQSGGGPGHDGGGPHGYQPQMGGAPSVPMAPPPPARPRPPSQQQHQGHQSEVTGHSVSMADMAFSRGVPSKPVKKDSITSGIKSDLARLTSRLSGSNKHTSLSSANLNVPGPQHVQTGSHGGAFIPLSSLHQPHCQLAGGGGGARMDHMDPASTPAHLRSKGKHGVLSSLIGKVRSGIADDRKKSTASGISSCSSGGASATAMMLQQQQFLIPRKHPVPTKDSQFQYNGPYPDNSAVAALARTAKQQQQHQQHQQRPSIAPSQTSSHQQGSSIAGSTLNLRRVDSTGPSRPDGRPAYTRAKSFVKSKSDDERTERSRLSKHSRARSAGALETESLLKALNLEDPKEAMRLLSLYQTLSRGLLGLPPRPQSSAAALHQDQMMASPEAVAQNTMAPTHQRLYNFMLSESQKNRDSGADLIEMDRNRYGGVNSGGRGSLKYSRSSSDSRASASGGRRPSSRGRNQEPVDMTSEDDYQQINPYRRDSGGPDDPDMASTARSHSAPPRRQSKAAAASSSINANSLAQVQVYVHQEPHQSPSKNNDFRMYSGGGYGDRRRSGGEILYHQQHHHHHNQHHHHHQSCSSSGGDDPVGGLLKKPVSCESFISFDSNSKEEGSRKSSIDFDRRSVVTIRRAASKSTLRQQHSWEGPPASTLSHKQSRSTPLLSPEDFNDNNAPNLSPSTTMSSGRGGGSQARLNNFLSGSVGNLNSLSRSGINPLFDDDEDFDLDGDPLKGGPLRKSESFEGHEEAVRSIVAAVQETRTLQRKKANNANNS